MSRPLHEHVGSPSLRHIRQPNIIRKLALKVLRPADGPTSPWQKGSAQRGFVAKADPCGTWPCEGLKAGCLLPLNLARRGRGAVRRLEHFQTDWT